MIWTVSFFTTSSFLLTAVQRCFGRMSLIVLSGVNWSATVTNTRNWNDGVPGVTRTL